MKNKKQTPCKLACYGVLFLFWKFGDSQIVSKFRREATGSCVAATWTALGRIDVSQMCERFSYEVAVRHVVSTRALPDYKKYSLTIFSNTLVSKGFSDVSNVVIKFIDGIILCAIYNCIFSPAPFAYLGLSIFPKCSQ